MNLSKSAIAKDLFLDIFGEVFYFPIWWYSQGLLKAALFCWQNFKYGWRALALGILLPNFFKPMFGQRGWEAYVLSLGSRIWQISWRLVLFLGWFLFWFLVLILWIGLPVFIIWRLVLV